MTKVGTIHARILEVDQEANGVARHENQTLLIPGGTAGDELRVRVTHESPHRPVSWCEIDRVESRGPDFIPPPCPHAAPLNGSCGGCPAMHMTREAQAEMKKRAVVAALEGEDLPSWTSWTEPVSTKGYRSRGQFVVQEKIGRITLGSFAPRSHRVVSMDGCPVVRAGINRTAETLERIFSQHAVPVHPAPFGLRYVTIRTSSSGKCLVDLVFNQKPLEATLEVARNLLGFPDIIGVSFCENSSKGNAIRTGPSTVLAGRETVREVVGEIGLELAASSFFQLNTHTAEAMYREAADILQESKSVLDLYCGVAGLGLTVATHTGAELYGAESVESAVELARRNAKTAKINGSFAVADLSKEVPFENTIVDGVAVNPPRRGLDEPVIDYLKKTRAKVIAYMSCNPKSFARDVKVLCETGWRVSKVSAHDMLPGTAHVEVIGELRR